MTGDPAKPRPRDKTALLAAEAAAERAELARTLAQLKARASVSGLAAELGAAAQAGAAVSPLLTAASAFALALLAGRKLASRPSDPARPEDELADLRSRIAELERSLARQRGTTRG